MLTAESKDGWKDGAQMKISKQKLKQIILEELEEVCGVPMQAQSPCADDHEASMAKSDLRRLHEYSLGLLTVQHSIRTLTGWLRLCLTVQHSMRTLTG